MTENPEEANKTETKEPAEHQQTEGEMVIGLLKTFQEDLKTEREASAALREEIKILNIRVNKELPEQLDQTFKGINDNFAAITRGLEAIPHIQQPTGVAAAAAQKDGGSMAGIIERIIGAIEKGITGGSEGGTLSEIDKEILKTSKAIQMITLKDVLKRTAKSAGIELADHVVVNP